MMKGITVSLMPIPAPRSKRRQSFRKSTLPSALELLNAVSSTSLGLVSPFMEWPADLNVEYPPVGEKTYRNLNRQVRHRIIYSLASQKNQRMVACESYNEQKMAYLLEAHPSVKAYVEQPFLLTWKDISGMRHKHVPDFLVTMRSGDQLVIEVKPDNALDDIKLIERTKLLNQLMPAFISKRYALVVASQIEGIALENAQVIKRMENTNVDRIEVEAIRRAFYDTKSPISIRALSNIVGISETAIKVRSLIRAGVIGFDMNRRFDDQTVLFWIGE